VRHRQAPGYVRIRIAIRVPVHVPSCYTAWPYWELFHSYESICDSPSCHITKNLATCAFVSLCVPPCVHPIPLQRVALLRVILLARTCPQRSRLHIPPKRCARARIFVSFCHIAWACVCTPFHYGSRVLKSRDSPWGIFLFELMRGNALTRACLPRGSPTTWTDFL